MCPNQDFLASLFEVRKMLETFICPPIEISSHKLWSSHKRIFLATMKVNVDILAYQFLGRKEKHFIFHSSHRSRLFSKLPWQAGMVMYRGQQNVDRNGVWPSEPTPQKLLTFHLYILFPCLMQRNIASLDAVMFKMQSF